MKINKPNVEQAKQYLEERLLTKIKELCNDLQKYQLCLSLLANGCLNDKIKIEDYKETQWHFGLDYSDLPYSVYDFVDKTKQVDKHNKVSTF